MEETKKALGDDVDPRSKELSLHPKTLDEAIERWDDGRSLFSISLGGLGPGYEQAIQITGIELIREFKGKSAVDWEDEETLKQLNKDVDSFGHKCKIIKNLRLSGAQFGAARNMAFVFIRNGWEKGLAMAPKDRHIQISKNFP